MGKVLILAGLTLLFILWVKSGVRQPGPRPRAQTGEPGGAPAGGDRPEVEPMVRCAVCGVHLPRGDAVLAQGRAYCSLEHAAKGGVQ